MVAPSPQRFAKNPVVRFAYSIADADGDIGRPWQSLDTLAAMAYRGSITAAMRTAGERFHDTFRRAGLDGLYAGDPCRVPVQLSAGSRVWNHTGGSEPARLQVMTALDALGGVQSPGGSCAWYVLGCEMSLRRWSLTANWAARRIDHKIAAGILVADLGILQAHWGL